MNWLDDEQFEGLLHDFNTSISGQSDKKKARLNLKGPNREQSNEEKIPLNKNGAKIVTRYPHYHFFYQINITSSKMSFICGKQKLIAKKALLNIKKTTAIDLKFLI